MKILIVIPAYNEAENIERVVDVYKRQIMLPAIGRKVMCCGRLRIMNAISA